MLKTHNVGFTLFEVLVALFVFSIFAVMVMMGLHVLLVDYRHLKKTNAQITKINLALSIMRNDVSEIIAKSDFGTHGDSGPPVLSVGSSQLEFTRTGFENPLWFFKRSEIERVKYRVKADELIRSSYPVYSSGDVKIHSIVLLKSITHWRCYFVSENKSIYSKWPVNNSLTHVLPIAIIFQFNYSALGEIKLIVPVVSNGVQDE